MDICRHIQTYEYTHAHAHAFAHTDKHARMHLHTHKKHDTTQYILKKNAQQLLCGLYPIQKNTHTVKHTRIHTHMHQYTHIYTYTHMCTTCSAAQPAVSVSQMCTLV